MDTRMPCLSIANEKQTFCPQPCIPNPPQAGKSKDSCVNDVPAADLKAVESQSQVEKNIVAAADNHCQIETNIVKCQISMATSCHIIDRDVIDHSSQCPSDQSLQNLKGSLNNKNILLADASSQTMKQKKSGKPGSKSSLTLDGIHPSSTRALTDNVQSAAKDSLKPPVVEQDILSENDSFNLRSLNKMVENTVLSIHALKESFRSFGSTGTYTPEE